MKIVDIAWLAGIIEGESWLGLSNNITPGISVRMTDRDIIEKVSIMFNCQITEPKKQNINYKQQYEVRIHSNKAIQWMMTIYPLMGYRRKESIKEAIKIWKERASGTSTIFSCGHLKIPKNSYSSGKYFICKTCINERSIKRYYQNKKVGV